MLIIFIVSYGPIIRLKHSIFHKVSHDAIRLCVDLSVVLRGPESSLQIHSCRRKIHCRYARMSSDPIELRCVSVCCDCGGQLVCGGGDRRGYGRSFQCCRRRPQRSIRTREKSGVAAD